MQETFMQRKLCEPTSQHYQIGKNSSVSKLFELFISRKKVGSAIQGEILLLHKEKHCYSCVNQIWIYSDLVCIIHFIFCRYIPWIFISYKNWTNKQWFITLAIWRDDFRALFILVNVDCILGAPSRRISVFGANGASTQKWLHLNETNFNRFP